MQAMIDLDKLKALRNQMNRASQHAIQTQDAGEVIDAHKAEEWADEIDAILRHANVPNPRDMA